MIEFDLLLDIDSKSLALKDVRTAELLTFTLASCCCSLFLGPVIDSFDLGRIAPCLTGRDSSLRTWHPPELYLRWHLANAFLRCLAYRARRRRRFHWCSRLPPSRGRRPLRKSETLGRPG